jgi:predicted dehydrogenase
MARFAAIGLDHRHIYDLVRGLRDAGQVCAGYWPGTTDPRVLAGFRKRFPDVPAADKSALLDDGSIDFVVTAAVPRDRAPLAIETMRRGKDVLLDKPGVTTLEQLAAVERVVAETGRIFSIGFGRYLTASTQVALDMVRAGAIGRVVQTVGLGPHRLNRALRPAWFFERAAYGGILNDIGVHQIDQFLAFAGTDDATIVMSAVGEFGTEPGFQDFGEIMLQSATARGYMRVDWFTADGLPTWGDGRLLVLGNEGTIELRKNLDIAGRPGTDHLFLVDETSTRYVDCSGRELTYFRDFAADVANRTATAMPQAHVFNMCRLALEAQARAARFVPRAS